MTQIKNEVIAAELERIRLANGGKLHPSDVVREARKKGNPLHSHPAWDGWNVEKAAQRGWVHQARLIIKSVTIINPEYNKPERKFINIRKTDVVESYYQKAEIMTPDEIELAITALDRSLDGLDRTIRQLRRLAENSGDDRLQAIIAIQTALNTAVGLAASLH